MTPQQEHVCLQNFKTSMIASGHGDLLDYDHSANFFKHEHMQPRWLGYKRCWEEQVLKEVATKMTATGTSYPAPVTVTDDFTPPNPNTEEFVFVGGPLHGLHHIDPNRPWVVTEHNSVQYLYVNHYVVREAPHMFILTRTHTLR